MKCKDTRRFIGAECIIEVGTLDLDISANGESTEVLAQKRYDIASHERKVNEDSFCTLYFCCTFTTVRPIKLS